MSENERDQRGVAARAGESTTAIARNAFYLVVGQAATTVLAVVFSAALGRTLGATDFGVYYLITTMSGFAYVLAEWGQPYFVIRHVAREPLRSGDLLGTALALRAAFAIVATIGAGLSAWVLGYGARTTWFSVFLILALLPMSLAQGYGMVFRGLDRMGKDATLSVANKLTTLCVALPALALGAAIPGVIFAQAVAGVGALGVAARLHRRLGAPPLRFSRETARELFTAGAPILAMSGAIAVQPYLDAIILSKLAPPTVVGWFAAAKSILGTLMAPAVILGAAAYPRLARASADAASFRREARAAFRPLLWLGAMAGTGTYLFAGTAIRLIYGSEHFGPAETVLEVFAPGLFLIFIDILLGNIIYASGGGKGFAIAKVLSVVVGTALDVVLIPLFQDHFGNGGIGVVVAFALSEFVVFTGAMMALHRGTLSRETGQDVVRALGSAGLTIFLFRAIGPIPPWAGIPLSIVAFAAASLALGLVDRDDVKALRALLRPGSVDPGLSNGTGP